MRSLKYYFVHPGFHLYRGIKRVWPAPRLKVFFSIWFKFSLSFTKLLSQSEHTLLQCIFMWSIDMGVGRLNRNGDIFCGKN